MKIMLLAAAFVIPLLAQSPAKPRVQSDGSPCELIDGGSHVLTAEMKRVLSSKYAGWRVRQQCAGETETDTDPKWASVASGDYDADGRVDQAVLLENLADGGTIVIVFMSSVRGGPVDAGKGNEHILTISRGARGHNFETEQDLTYETDALYIGDYRCCGDSLIWRNGKFFRFPSSD